MCCISLNSCQQGTILPGVFAASVSTQTRSVRVFTDWSKGKGKVTVGSPSRALSGHVLTKWSLDCIENCITYRCLLRMMKALF